MNEIKPVKIAVIGSGMISDIYLKNMIERFDILDVAGICSAHPENAAKKAEKYGISAMTFEQILADERIEMIVNLTPAPAHEEIIRRALNAGKHVYTEKTMTMDHESAGALRQLALDKGLLLCSAPDTFLGAALQNARRAIDEGLIGTVNSFAAASNRGNDYLRSFYRFLNLPGGGVGYDYSVYYLTAIMSLLGPAAQTTAVVRAPYPTHIDINPAYPTYGSEIETPGESEICAILKMRSGAVGTIHFNNDSTLIDQAFIALYGTKGILYLPNPDLFGGTVEYLPQGSDMIHMPQRQKVDYGFAFGENSRGIGPADMAYAIREHRTPRAESAMAYHVLETVDAMIESGKTSRYIDIESTFDRPTPMKIPTDGNECSAI